MNTKRPLQIVVGVLAATPVGVGLAGIVLGPAFLGLKASWPADLDSHFRFLSGVFLAVGISWYSCIPDIGARTGRFRLLAAMTFAGGLARLLSLSMAGAPSVGHLAGLCVELVVVPLLVVWQARVARAGSKPANHKIVAESVGANAAAGLYSPRRSALPGRSKFSPGP